MKSTLFAACPCEPNDFAGQQLRDSVERPDGAHECAPLPRAEFEAGLEKWDEAGVEDCGVVCSSGDGPVMCGGAVVKVEEEAEVEGWGSPVWRTDEEWKATGACHRESRPRA